MADTQDRIGQSIGDYRLLRLLGKGRFGSVYLAEHLYEHTSAAVKVLRMPLTGPNDFDGFMKEARTVRLLHPHIVSLFDFDLSRDGFPYVAMTYADGGSLRDRYAQGTKLPLQAIDTYVQQLASALQYAHDCHVIHHDVKPENMLVSNDGTVQLSDFSIAKIAGRAGLRTQPKVVETSAYTAPEQCQGQSCPASDQYALAIVVYEWLTGQCPFQGDLFAMAWQHQMGTPPSLSSINPEVPLQVEEVIFKALAKAPKYRYPTITYFAEALHVALQEDDEPTEIHAKVTPLAETPAETSLPPQLVLAAPSDAQTPDANELHNAPTWAGFPISTQDEATHALPVVAPLRTIVVIRRRIARKSTSLLSRVLPMGRIILKRATTALPTSITLTEARTEEKLQPKATQQAGEIPASLPGAEQSQQSSALAKGRLKKIIQHQRVGDRYTPPLHTLINGRPTPLAQQRLRPVPTWMRLVGSFLIVALIGGVFSVLLHLLPTLLVSPTQTSGVTATPISQAATHDQIPSSSPQHQAPTPTPTPQTQVPTPTPPVISPAISAGKLLYSTPDPFSACDKLGGHWTDTSDARVICNADGSEMVNTSGHLAVANLDQLAGNQSSWPSQNCIIQVQATINPNSQGAFGIDFQPDANNNAQGYFAYVFNPPNGWAFNYYNTPGNLTNTLTSAQLRSSVSTKLTIDIRVEGTFYIFYVNGVDTTGRAVTGSQYINKIVGLAVDANADITFSNLAIYALP